MRTRLLFLFLCCFIFLHAQAQQYELTTGWRCINIHGITAKGEEISKLGFPLTGFINATVPGTVLTTMLNNKMVPDPFYGMNNNQIPDIYTSGSDYYTYWFVNEFSEKVNDPHDVVWLHLRGINYSCDVFLNGHKLNSRRFYGMFLRQQYNITPWLAKDGRNRLAVIVFPPNPVGNPNGGQGGDGTLARNVSHQYVAGWDWIQPVRDRNTGIWDKVSIEKTGPINVQNVHVITQVPGKRWGEGPQAPATIKVSAELLNAGTIAIRGVLTYQIGGRKISLNISVPAHTTLTAILPDYRLPNPQLWWPNGYGGQYLYRIEVSFMTLDGKNSDTEPVSFGVREISTSWNMETHSRQVLVNGQRIFIKGGNWIVSDEMLRLSANRYDAEIRFHRDMNLNLIRVWGGALTERPEFYDACDKYGILVLQDFWNSGDCNGRWMDPKKKDDQWTRRTYPDDHPLFLASVADQVKMIRNHPSLALWCGGNEITPPEDILLVMKDSIIPQLDGTRYFIEYSNSDSLSRNSLGGNGDGPYGIQDPTIFWQQKNFPFNSEVGSVGMGDYESLLRFIPKENLSIPGANHTTTDSVWEYHKYLGYGQSVNPYGTPTDLKDFAEKAQLVNYDQYRALIEGCSAHMWEWYSGVIIWKTQNPWTALRGQMYDYYLDPNAGLYGLRKGSEPFHVMYSPADGMILIANNTFLPKRNIMLQAKVFDMDGKEMLFSQVFSEIGATQTKKYFSLKEILDSLAKDKGAFLYLALQDQDKMILSSNLYWLANAAGNYSGLQQMKQALVNAVAQKTPGGTITVTIHNPMGNPVAFFNRLSVVDKTTRQRILPAFYSDNYFSVTPGETTSVRIDCKAGETASTEVELRGWNVDKQYLEIQ